MLVGDSAMEKNKGINGIQGVQWGQEGFSFGWLWESSLRG